MSKTKKQKKRKGNKSVFAAWLPQTYRNETYQKLWMQASYMFIAIAIYIYIYIYRVSQEEWTKLRESVPYVKLYRYITQNTYIQSWMVMEIMAIEKCGLLGYPRTVSRPWRHTHPLHMPGNEKPLANIGMQWPWWDKEQLRPA